MTHPSSFLTRYEQWRGSFPGLSVGNLDFCILILTICAYSAQCLPSRSFPATKIRGVPHNTIREHCYELATRSSAFLPGKRSLTCVQHLYCIASRLGACKLGEVMGKLDALERSAEKENPIATSGLGDHVQTSRTLNSSDFNADGLLGSELVRDGDAASGWTKDFSTDVSEHLTPKGTNGCRHTIRCTLMDVSPFHSLPVNSDVGRANGASVRSELEVEVQSSRPQPTTPFMYRQSLPSAHEILQNPAQYKSDWQLSTETMDSLLQSQLL